MKKYIFTFLFICISLFLFSSTVYSEIIDLNDSNFQKEVFDKNSDKLVVVGFYNTNCPKCQIQTLVFRNLEKDSAVKDVKMVMINGIINVESANSLNINGYPALVFVKRGKILEICGLREEEALKKLITKYK